MPWINKIITRKNPTNPASQKIYQVIPGASLTTSQTVPQQALSVSRYPTSFLNAARYSQALGIGVGGAWWDLLDNYHSTTGYSIYDYPD